MRLRRGHNPKKLIKYKRMFKKGRPETRSRTTMKQAKKPAIEKDEVVCDGCGEKVPEDEIFECMACGKPRCLSCAPGGPDEPCPRCVDAADEPSADDVLAVPDLDGNHALPDDDDILGLEAEEIPLPDDDKDW